MGNDAAVINERGGVLKKLVAAASAVVLAVSLVPMPAYASAGQSGSDGWFDLPTEKITTFEHEGVDAQGNAYKYSYLSSAIENVVGGFSQSIYYLMGINGANFDRGIRPANGIIPISGTRMTTSAVSAVAGIMGTSVNSQPDEYLWNSCYQMYVDKTNANLPTAGTTDQTQTYVSALTAGNPSSPKIEAEINGTPYQVPLPIYYEVNFVNEDGGYWADRTIAQWAEIETQRAGRPFGRTAADVYSPKVATWSNASGGIYFGADLVYKMADAIDKATDESRDANGNATLMSRYVDANGASTNGDKFNSALELAQTYEDFAKATQYDVIARINSGQITKKVVAIVCGYQPAKDGAEAAYAVRIFDSAQDTHNSADYGGRLANSMMNFTTDLNSVLSAEDIAFEAFKGNWTDPDNASSTQENVDDTTHVRWYPASTIAKNADAIFVCDAPYGNNRANYLAINQDNYKASIYTVDNVTYARTNENVQPLVNACDAADAKADLFYKYPDHLFGVWYAQGFENCWMGPISSALLYQDNFTTVENIMAYAARTFWHINAADVTGVVQAVCHDVSIPKGGLNGAPDSNYLQIVNDLIDEGNRYYLSSTANRAAIDALNGGDLKTQDLDALTARYTTVYRMYNPWSHEHLLTGDKSEYDTNVKLGWTGEAVAFNVPVTSTVPVYRLYNQWTGEHFWTTDASEMRTNVDAGWTFEKEDFFSDPAQGTPVYRLYNPYATEFTHHYTASVEERDANIAAGWVNEEIGFYGTR